MLQALVNQFYTMPLGEELHTICFTLFLVGGAVSCFRRREGSRGVETIERIAETAMPASLALHRPARIRHRPTRMRTVMPHPAFMPPRRSQLRAVA